MNFFTRKKEVKEFSKNFIDSNINLKGARKLFETPDLFGKLGYIFLFGSFMDDDIRKVAKSSCYKLYVEEKR